MDFSFLIGKTEDKAREILLAEHNLTMRVTSKEGETLFGTTDIRTNRLNVSITDGVVSSIGQIK